MLRFLDKITGYIAPHECLACGAEGSLLCAICLPLLPDIVPQCYRCHRTDKGNKTCISCRKQTPIKYLWVRTSYEGFAEQLIRDLKFNHAMQAAETVATALYEEFGSQFPPDAVFVPIPTATRRVRQRGYDQSVLIAKALAQKTGFPYARILVRHGQQRQTGSNRSERLSQLEHAFSTRQPNAKPLKKVILVDDVITTGATLTLAAKTLKQYGVQEITAVVFAKAE